MPELPEVEVVVLELRNQIIGESFLGVQINQHNLRIPIPKVLPALLEKQVIITVSRQAKYVLIHLANDHVLVLHLGMSGKILINPSQQFQKHNHVIFYLTNNNRIVFNDPRRFGLITIYHLNNLAKSFLFKNYGPEPLSREFNSTYLSFALQNKTTPIKISLMNNKVLVGVGNIYACESLFHCKISPLRKSNSLKTKEINKLISAIKNTLKKAIAAGGSTLKNYVNTRGELGYFQHEHKVYGRTDLNCTNCNTSIKQIIQSGRSTFYCPNCQK